jgi:hypothetical protein
MRALVVFESILGNTEVIARAVAEGLGEGGEVEVVEVGAAPSTLPAGVDLLVVGGPTHAHGMTNPDSRRSAAQKAQRPVVSTRIGIREWLAAVGAAPAGVTAAAFDTRIKGPGLLWGSAAKAAAGRLEDQGFQMAAPPECFLVKGPTGPVHDVLVAGEVDRARRWGATLAAKTGAAAKGSAAPGR